MTASQSSSAAAQAYRTVVAWGVNPLDREQERRITGANHLYALGAIISLPWVALLALAAWPDTIVPAATHLVMVGLWTVCLCLARSRRHTAAAVIGLGVPTVQFSWLTFVFSMHAGFQLPLIVFAAVAVLVAAGRWRWLSWLVVVVVIAVLALSAIAPEVRTPVVDVSDTWLTAAAVANSVATVGGLALLGVFHNRVFAAERRRNQELLAAAEIAARTDSLTELYNRRGIAPIMSAIAREDQYALALVDLDRFKRVNDRLGHGAGDVVLANVARTLVDAIGEAGTVARWGGEEFLVVLPGMTATQAVDHVEAARRHIEEEYGTDGVLEHVTMSAGVAHAPRLTGKEEVLRLADAKLYEAKASGRNLVVGASLQGPPASSLEP